MGKLTRLTWVSMALRLRACDVQPRLADLRRNVEFSPK